MTLFGLTPGDILAILLFVSVLASLLVGYPIAFSLAGSSILFGLVGNALGVFDWSFMSALPPRYLGIMRNEVLVAVPLFVFMGFILERSGIAEDLLITMGQLFGKLRGGLGISVVIVGAMLAASTGVVGATVVTMGLISLPAMLRAKYDPRLATGVICASATLSQIIPPSTILIVLGDLLAGVNQQAQAKLGNLAPDPVSVGDLFAGALFPGLILVGLYMLWMVYKAVMEPMSCPAIALVGEELRGLPRRVLLAMVPPLLLIVAVLGSILGGVATATESASIGALGAVLLAALNRRLSLDMIRQASHNTMMTAGLVFVIVLAASLFSLTFRGLGGEHLVEQALTNTPGGRVGALLIVMAVMFLLGFFLDTFEIILITVPICGTALLLLGYNPVWLGVMIGMNLQTSFLTPPFGYTLFYMRGVAPASVTTPQIWSGVFPWITLQVIGMLMLWFYPQIATWLPEYIFREESAIVAPQSLDQHGVPKEDDLTVPFEDPKGEGEYELPGTLK
ncbi:TRAP transporter large permease subunit [Desertibaculum subflavum]|uniref:TRAP transporter large permease subunit n=1 Tax=Desertibaculum subflavum TaxID=2268458 RepID=UPI0034D267F6